MELRFIAKKIRNMYEYGFSPNIPCKNIHVRSIYIESLNKLL